ncbi:gene transfer agent family protein [Novosphingobium olei]|uniref:Gene transfer agent family protein n=1 Tax=Novosphingobium olei TaxID=2728851 RepID=A0A7Y0GAM9_9SPHN|nr:gene transfer agent family protein [Novosphingobium olei]NML95421.1 gene transfer agent family protein [Novosphingobium olei]BEU99031.1 gene transfer agent family protein [Novosphingobium olei]
MSAVANPHRGELSLVLQGVEHVLRPTFSALVAAEQELGSLFHLVERASGGELKLAELATLFWHCLREHDTLDREAFGDALVQAGLTACAPVLRALLAQVLKGAA